MLGWQAWNRMQCNSCPTVFKKRPPPNFFAYRYRQDYTLLNVSLYCNMYDVYVISTVAEYKTDDYARLTLEGLTLLGVITYLSLAIQNLRETGKERFLEMLLVT